MYADCVHLKSSLLFNPDMDQVSHLHVVSEEDVESSGHGIRTSMEAHRHLVIRYIRIIAT